VTLQAKEHPVEQNAPPPGRPSGSRTQAGAVGLAPARHVREGAAVQGRPFRPGKARRRLPELPELPEAVVQARIVAYLAAREIVFTVSDASRPFGPDGKPRPSRCRRGWPDICGCLPGGRFFGIEVKSACGRLRPAQIGVLRAIAAAGGLALVARRLETVMRVLEPLLGVSRGQEGGR
jgi:hypothetical protein